MSKLLVLAGTRDARLLCEALHRAGHDVTASLAGATTDPVEIGVPTRRGGFGGIAGLVDWLTNFRPEAVIDATHPFATDMPRHASAACGKIGLQRLRFLRPPWPVDSDWNISASSEEIAAALPSGARVLLTTGRKSWEPFAARSDINVFLRSVEPIPNLSPSIEQIIARPPFSADDERALFRLLGLTHLVVKNSGGAVPAKLGLASELGMRVSMISRPPPISGPVCSTIDACVAWANACVADSA